MSPTRDITLVRSTVSAIALLVAGGVLASLHAEQIREQITYAQAETVLEALHAQRPAELKGLTAVELRAKWTKWVSARDAELRARVIDGDEDSVLNLLLLGTTFTKQPRVLNDSLTAAGLEHADPVVRAR